MVVGIIGGSGLYELGIEGETIAVETPYGKPSGDLFKSKVGEHTALFLARHGKGHVLTPSEINYRANVYAFKKLGATALISISAVGSLRKEIGPGDFVLPDQYIDVTKGQRVGTFFGNGVVGHVPFADPACAGLREYLAGACRKIGVKTHPGGVYVCMEGPQFSTRAESFLYRSWKLEKEMVSVIGMTALPEAKLAREAGLCYQTVAMATDYDCWNDEKGDVSVEEILRVLHQNVETSRKLVKTALSQAFPPCRNHCADLMKNAVVTPKELWAPSRRDELEIILR